MNQKSIKLILCGIFLLAIFLRLFKLTVADSYTDEVLYSFRGMGMIDYDTSDSQTTPWQWVSTVPNWMHLSFNDHPIGFFAIEHFFIKLFGENLIAIRLPAVLAGLGSLFIFFLIIKRLFSIKTALVTSFLFAINSYLIWVSRIGIQDGVVLFFMLLSIWLWLKAVENKNYYLLCGFVVGLALLTKYTALILFPIFLWYLFIFNRKDFKDKKLWIGFVITIVTISPIWLYNIYMYRTFGHFDFQISAALHQQVPEWNFRLGRMQVGNLANRFKNFFIVMYSAQSILFNLLWISSVLYIVYSYIKTREKNSLFIFGVCVLVFLWFLVIGSTYRFVVTIIPFLLLTAAAFLEYFLSKYYDQRKKIIFVILAVFGLLEILFTSNSFYVAKSFGKENITYAKINEETQNFGFNQLDKYIVNLLKNKYTYFSGKPDYQFLTELKDKNIKELKDSGAKPLSAVIVYEGGLNFLAVLWSLDRHLYYDGWPVMDDVVFYKNTGDQFDKFYRKIGVEKFVYIVAANDSVLSVDADKNRVNLVKDYVKNLGVKPKIITNFYGEPAFYVYEF